VTDGQGADLGRAEEVYVEFADRNKVPATVVGVDPNADVALLRLNTRAGLTLRPVELGSSEKVRVGEPVAAIGSPFGEDQSLSVGVVSALDRSIESLTGFAISGAIQTDAAINKGNSGGPLLDAQGRVLGINSQIRSSSGVGSGVGFAVNADTVRRSIAELREGGRVRYAYLGVTSTSVYPQLAERFDLGVDHGAWVQETSPGGPSARAGIRGGAGERVRFQAGAYARGGDVIVEVAGRTVGQDQDLGRVLQHLTPGQDVPVEIVRDGRRETIEVTLGERPSRPE